jgi:hypothetical protein
MKTAAQQLNLFSHIPSTSPKVKTTSSNNAERTINAISPRKRRKKEPLIQEAIDYLAARSRLDEYIAYIDTRYSYSSYGIAQDPKACPFKGATLARQEREADARVRAMLGTNPYKQ